MNYFKYITENKWTAKYYIGFYLIFLIISTILYCLGFFNDVSYSFEQGYTTTITIFRIDYFLMFVLLMPTVLSIVVSIYFYFKYYK